MNISPAKILFLDRDGTLIEEPADEQIDSYEKFRLLPRVLSALKRLTDAGYQLVMVSNQDGLGTSGFPLADFEGPQRLLLETLASEGIVFRDILIDRHRPEDGAPTRKPGVGLVREYLQHGGMDRRSSAVVGDRESDLEFARNLGVRGFRIGADGDWPAIAQQLLDRSRHALIERITNETKIVVEVDLDQANRPDISTGLGFFDHMLEQLGVHGGFSLKLRCEGDQHIDEHHTVEDCAITLGKALNEALGERRGIGRYGFLLPMDEAQAQVALDLSGRAFFRFEGRFPRDRVGELPTELVPHFFHSLSQALGATLHLKIDGENTHHMVEACFKVVGRSLRQALHREGDAMPSSKGVL